jgi:TPR repeat protein
MTTVFRAFVLATFTSLALATSGVAQPQDAFSLGFQAYERGDYTTALRFLRPLAEQGNARAQYNLGIMYDNGEGVPENDAEAVKWYRLAADQGLAFAQSGLGLMYANGKGLPRDYAEGYKWLALAAAQHDEFASQRDAVRRLMTPAQVAEAQKLAAEWKQKE